MCRYWSSLLCSMYTVGGKRSEITTVLKFHVLRNIHQASPDDLTSFAISTVYRQACVHYSSPVMMHTRQGFRTIDRPLYSCYDAH